MSEEVVLGDAFAFGESLAPSPSVGLSIVAVVCPNCGRLLGIEGTSVSSCPESDCSTVAPERMDGASVRLDPVTHRVVAGLRL